LKKGKRSNGRYVKKKKKKNGKKAKIEVNFIETVVELEMLILKDMF
jgi:hypothetical protein